MAKTLDVAAIAEFDAVVKHEYQGMGKLRPSVRVKTGVVGSTHRFPKMGKGLATKRVPQTDVVPMNIQHTNATATLEDWNAAEFTDIFDQAKTNVDERRELAVTIAGAITRREDQLIIDALEAAATTLTVATSVGGAGTDLNSAKARRAKRLLDAGGVPAGNRTFVHSAVGLEAMLGQTDVTSSDFNSIKALVDGEFDTWLGFKWMMIEDRDEGGLTLAATLRTSFAYHMQSTGLAVGIDFTTEVNYIPVKTSWLANGLFSAGAIAIDADGIVEITSTEAP